MFYPHELLDGEVGGGHTVRLSVGRIALPVAVMEQCFGQIGEAGMLEHTAEERVIFGRREHGFVAEAVFLQHGSAYHDGRMAQGAARHQGRSDVAVREGEFPRLFRDHVPDLTAHDAHVGMSVEEGDLLFEALGQRDVVMIHDGEILALRHIEQTVAGRRDAEIALVDSVDDARIGVRFHYLFYLRLGGAVVENEKLKVLERLREYAVDSFAQMFGPGVVYGEKDGYAGHGVNLFLILFCECFLIDTNIFIEHIIIIKFCCYNRNIIFQFIVIFFIRYDFCHLIC